MFNVLSDSGLRNPDLLLERSLENCAKAN